MRQINEQELPKVLPGCSGGTLPGRSTKEKGREERGVDENGGERRISCQIVPEVVAGIKEKVGVHDGDKGAVQNPAGQSFLRSWDSSQMENEEEEESWREGDRMPAQWEEEEKLEEIVERRRIQKVAELVVQKRVSHGKGVKGPKEKKRVPGWSIEEMKEKPNIAVEDTEEMKK